jgi:virginiamycin B lyase
MEGVLSSLLVRVIARVFLVEAAVCPVWGPRTAEVAELKASIQEWDVPTRGARPYATAVTPDGSVWFTEEMINKIGRVNPRTGEVKEYPLTEDNNARPHGIAVDRNGSIWYAANSGGLIGRLEPSTGKVAVFRMPDPKAKDPDGLAFDSKGILWFTLPTANMVGRLDPASGAITIKAVPTPNARPNGILVLKRDLIVFCEAGTSKIGFIAPATFAISEFPLPPGSRSRRLAVAADQNTLYFTDFAGGNLGKMDLSIGALALFPSPGGPDSNPYGLSITPDGMVWYTETGTQPNNIIRFDPGLSTFARAPIPFAAGVVHDLTATPDGRIYLASSGIDKIAAVEVSK